MNTLVFIGGLIALSSYLPLWRQMWKNQVKQNLLTWILWGFLDLIGTTAIIFQNGNYILPFVYTIGSIVTILLILKSGEKSKWTWFETMVVIIVLICITVWYFTGNKIAIIAISIAGIIATFPQFIDAWKKPEKMPLVTYVICMIANVFSTMGGKSWTIEERFFPFSSTIMCLILVVLSFRKFFKNKN